jgi:hypothetical protein
VLDFPGSGEKRVPQGTAEVSVRVRALKWVLADRSVAGGWRAVAWTDLPREDLLGTAPPELPAKWLERRPLGDWTVDLVDLRASRPDMDTLFAIQDIVAARDQLLKHEQVSMGKVDGREQLVIKDPANPQNIQPLTWNDLQKFSEIKELPKLPATWYPGVENVSLLQVETKLAELEVPFLQKVKTAVLDPLNQLADSGEHKNSFRRLVIPQKVRLSSWGRDTRDEAWLDKLGDSNEYEGKFKQLKESIRFRAYGEDFATKSYSIVVVPPPALERLVNEAEHPAYLYYRIPQGASVAEFKTFRQKIVARQAAVSGAETRLDVPAGSNLTLTAAADKDLDAVVIEPAPKAEVRVNVPVTMLDARHFQVRLENIRAPLDFYFSFTDTDGVHGRRRMVITPLEDREPEPGVGVEVVRKTNQGYMVTPYARIPFSGRITDDHGLEEAGFTYAQTRLDASSQAAEQLLDLLAPLYQFSGGIDQSMAAAVRFVEKARAAGKEKPKEENPGLKYTAMPGFTETVARYRRIETAPLAELRQRLQDRRDPDMKDPRDPKLPADERKKAEEEFKQKFLLRLFRDYNLEPKEDVLDLEPLLPQVADPNKEKQGKYRVQVWVDAVDTDIETGPHRTRSKESFVFLVVPENDLLLEMARDQETQHIRLEDTTEGLRKALVKMDQANIDLKSSNLKAEDLPRSALPANFEQLLDKSQEATREVKEAFEKLIEEARVNRVRATGYVARLQGTVQKPLEEIGSKWFPQAKDAMTKFRETLDNNNLDLAQKVEAAKQDGANARDRLNELIEHLNAVLNAMDQIKGFNDVIKSIRAIEEENTRQHEIMHQVQEDIKKRLLQGLDLFEGTKPEDKKPEDKK